MKEIICKGCGEKFDPEKTDPFLVRKKRGTGTCGDKCYNKVCESASVSKSNFSAGLKCPFVKKVKKEHKIETKFIALSTCPFTEDVEHGAYAVECSCGARGPYAPDKELAIKLWKAI